MTGLSASDFQVPNPLSLPTPSTTEPTTETTVQNEIQHEQTDQSDQNATTTTQIEEQPVDNRTKYGRKRRFEILFFDVGKKFEFYFLSLF